MEFKNDRVVAYASRILRDWVSKHRKEMDSPEAFHDLDSIADVVDDVFSDVLQERDEARRIARSMLELAGQCTYTASIEKARSAARSWPSVDDAPMSKDDS
jgi:hypothetical protein